MAKSKKKHVPNLNEIRQGYLGVRKGFARAVGKAFPVGSKVVVVRLGVGVVRGYDYSDPDLVLVDLGPRRESVPFSVASLRKPGMPEQPE